MNIILEGASVSLCLSLLIYASWSDYKTREVSDNVWILFSPLAFALTFVDLYFYGPSGALFSYGIIFGLTVAFAMLLFYTGAFGGADAKALMCLALALPFYPGTLLTPLFGESRISQVFFPFTIFANAVLLAAMTAAYMFFRNVFWHKKTGREIFEGEQQKESLGKKILILVTGYKVSLSKLKQKWYVYPMEDVEETDGELRRKLVIIPREEDRDAIVGRLTKAVDAGEIQDMIWATPGLPMLIFITAGLIVALFFGDIVWICISFLLR